MGFTANILNITTPITPKDYQLPKYNNNSQANDSGQVFNLGDQTQVVKVNTRTEDFAEQDLKDTLLNTPENSGKAESVEAVLSFVKDLLSKETVELISQEGDKQIMAKLAEFADEVMLTPENLTRDMINQQSNATIFSGKLWDTLRAVMKNSSAPDISEAVMDFAKATANNAQKNEILTSLSDNFKYLATELAPSKDVSNELLKASEMLRGADAGRNFEALKSTLVKLINYTEESLLLDNNSQKLLPLIIHTMSRYNDDPTSLKQSFDTVMNLFDSVNFGEKALQELQTASGAAEPSRESIRETVVKLFDNFIIKSDIPQSVKSSSVSSEKVIADQNKLASLTKMLAAGVKVMSERIDADILKTNLGTINPQNGSAAIKLAVASLTPNTPAMADALNTIIKNYDDTGDLSSLINRLSVLLESVDDMDKKLPLAHVLNESLSVLAEEAGDNYTPPTALDTLADFLVKNIDDSALQSLSSMNSGDMIKTMLTNPGVFNPLMHFFVPIEADGTRAFGELWVDKNADRQDYSVSMDEGVSETSHIFLNFELEDVGYFEMEMFARDENISIMLLCPEGTETRFAPLKTSVPRIAAASGYRVTAAIVDTLVRKRTLNEVFPILSKKRGGFDANA